MSQTQIIQETAKEGPTLFRATYLEMRNASLVFLSEREGRLGTLAAAVPQKEQKIGPPLSSVLLGDRNVMVARFLAEHLASKTDKLALVSVFIESLNERDAGPILLRLIEKIFRKKEAEE